MSQNYANIEPILSRDSAEIVPRLPHTSRGIQPSRALRVCSGCFVGEDMQELIRNLLDPDPQTRMGAKGAGELKEQMPLLGVDWGHLTEGNAKSPLANRAAAVIRANSASGKGGPPAAAADGEAVQPDFAAVRTHAEWLKEF